MPIDVDIDMSSNHSSLDSDDERPHSPSPELGLPSPSPTPPPPSSKPPSLTLKSRRRTLRLFLKRLSGRTAAYTLLLRPYTSGPSDSHSVIWLLVNHGFVGEVLLEWWKKSPREAMSALEGWGVQMGIRVALGQVLSSEERAPRKEKEGKKGKKSKRAKEKTKGGGI